MDTMQEMVGLLYVSLAIAAGGNDLLEDSNDTPPNPPCAGLR
jgi:hypothetical protein